MIRSGVDDAEGISPRDKVAVHRSGNGPVLVLEINSHNTAQGAAHLIQQPGGLAEIDVFGVLANLGDLLHGEGAPAEQAAYDRPHQHLKTGGGGETGAPGDVGDDIGVKTGDGIAQLRDLCQNPPNDGAGGVRLRFDGGEIAAVNPGQPISLGVDIDCLGAVGSGAGQCVQIHRPGQYPAPLMIGMVAPDLGAAGGGEERNGGAVIFSEGCCVTLHDTNDAIPEGRELMGGAAIETGKQCVIGAVCQRLLDFRNCTH